MWDSLTHKHKLGNTGIISLSWSSLRLTTAKGITTYCRKQGMNSSCFVSTKYRFQLNNNSTALEQSVIVSRLKKFGSLTFRCAYNGMSYELGIHGLVLALASHAVFSNVQMVLQSRAVINHPR